MIQPTVRCAWLLLAGVPVALLPAVIDERLWPVWLGLLLACLLLIGIDAFLVPGTADVRVSHAAPEVLYIGAESELRIALAAPRATRALELELVCDLDEELERQPAQRCRLAPAEEHSASVALRPRRRGTCRVERVWLRWSGPLGLVRLTTRHPLDRELGVVPDVQAVRAAALRFYSNPQALAGLKTERYLGDGTEFDSLQPYSRGLDARSIDWKASARHRRLVSRRFRAERNHQVILAIDGGRLMSEPLGSVPRLDHAINSALLLGYFCLRTGDRVGMYAFDARPRAWLEPRGGVHAFRRVQEQSAEVEYSSAETNYTLGVLELARRLNRRSLVVVFTEFVDTVTAELMLDNIASLARRHVIVFVALRDPELDELEQRRPGSANDLCHSIVAADLRRERELVFRRLRQLGVHLIDALPTDLSVDLLNRYFEIKRREFV